MTSTHHPWTGAVLAYPMHGQRKLLAEGYRTRDGHVIEWLGRSLGPRGGVDVVSRPEPVFLRGRRPGRAPAPGTHPIDTCSHRLPNPFDRRRWWSTSTADHPRIGERARATPAVVWNPFVALARPDADPFRGDRVTVLDLLDDWSRHHAFASIRTEVERAYAAAFARATHVTANGEGTVALARRFGRDDVRLVPNGCDPDRFPSESAATGPTTVGYVGKIGRRLDLRGVLRTIAALPEVRFVFAGPVLDRGHRRPLAALPNVELLGDVHYDHVPALLAGFDVGWVPHRVGDGEVGGDVIKTYEYRAAGLPVLSTPIDGAAGRGLDGVTAAPIDEHTAILAGWAGRGPRVPRRRAVIPAAATWRHTSAILAELLIGTVG